MPHAFKRLLFFLLSTRKLAAKPQSPPSLVRANRSSPHAPLPSPACTSPEHHQWLPLLRAWTKIPQQSRTCNNTTLQFCFQQIRVGVKKIITTREARERSFSASNFYLQQFRISVSYTAYFISSILSLFLCYPQIM